MSDILFPNLLSGSNISGIGNENIWITEIQCILRFQPHGGKPQDAYLSHECRGENVPGAKDGNCAQIFLPPYEVMTLHTWEGDYAFYSGAYVQSQPKKPEPQLFDYKINVRCPDSPVTLLEAENVGAALLNTSCAVRNLFMKLSWRDEAGSYELFAPCRYVNIPNPDIKTSNYVQPISGYVLYYDGKVFYTAYVVVVIIDQIVVKTEFNLRVSVNFFDTKPAGKMQSFLRWLSCLPPVKYHIMTHEFIKTISVVSTCQFYTYKN